MLTHPGAGVWPVLIVGVFALFGLARTRFSLFSSLIAVVLPSAMVALVGDGLIKTVIDSVSIPLACRRSPYRTCRA